MKQKKRQNNKPIDKEIIINLYYNEKLTTCLNNFGVEYPTQSKIVLDKIKKTLF